MAPRGLPLRILTWLDDRPAITIPLTLSLVVLLFILDHVTGIEISFSIFYMVPVALAAWCVGSPIVGNSRAPAS